MTKRIVFLPDTQLPFEARKEMQAVIRFIGDVQPYGVVHIGDILDLPQPSRWNKGTKGEFEGSVYRDADYAKKHLLEPLRKVYDGWIGAHEGNHDCSWTNARAVTRRGFVHVDDLTTDDKVMSVDDQGRTIWQQIDEVVRFPFSGTLYSLGGREINATITANHRVVGLNREKTKWVEHTPTSLPGNKMWVYTAGEGSNEDYPLTDTEIRLAVWGLTDSHRSPDGRWTFYQSGEKAEQVRKLLADAGIEYRERARNRGITEIDGKVLKAPPKTQYEFSLGKVQELDDLLDRGRSELPTWTLSLSQRQARLFLEEYRFTDGTDTTSAGDSYVLYVCKDRMREQLQMLAAANGLRASTTEYRPGHWRLNISNRTLSGLYKNTVEEVAYEGEVWCLRVPNGRFFIEDGGKIHLTGNSRARDYLSKNAPALEGTHAFDIDVLLDFDGFGVELLPDFYDIAPGWISTHGHMGKMTLSQIAGSTALNGAKKFGKSVVCGHTHRQAVVSHSFGYGGSVRKTVTGMEVGHLMDMKKANYLKGGAGNWQMGFGMLTVDGKHVKAEIVPILGGKFTVDGQVWEV
ncbi:phosphoesterase [Mycobacterium phage Corvo]|nr:phosphoesterase [Mycobacterium phage Corvo]